VAKPTDPNEVMRRAQPSWWQILLGILGALLIWSLLYQLTLDEPEELTYSEFKAAVRAGEVARVTIEGDSIRGRFKAPAASEARAESTGDKEKTESGESPEAAQAAEGESADKTGQGSGAPLGEPFRTTKPRVDDPGLLTLLEEQGVTVDAVSPEPAWWQQAIAGLLPWLLILGVIVYMSYRMQQRLGGGGDGGPGGIFGFAKSKAKRFRQETTKTTLDDVAGLANAKRDLKEIIDNLAHPERYRTIGAKIPKGVLLVGPPGTGKTLLARAVAGEAGVPFYSISGSEFVEMFVGVGAARVRDMFESAKKEAPCVIFIDEIDAVGRARGTGVGGGHDEREQTLNQILNEMDGFTPHQNVVVLAATNRPDVLDQALLRPGRFDRKVFLEMPDREARAAILKVHTRKVPLAEDVDLDKVAARTIGFSGADLENLVNEAALLAGRERKDEVDMDMLDRARDKLVLGAERERGIGEEERAAWWPTTSPGMP
jgi:cell division protease FtsH